MRPAPKPTVWRDPDYLAFLRRCPCVVCIQLGIKAPSSEAAHLRTKRGHGDTWAVPLCINHHRQQHADGIKSFIARHKLDVDHLCADYRAAYEGKERLSF